MTTEKKLKLENRKPLSAKTKKIWNEYRKNEKKLHKENAIQL